MSITNTKKTRYNNDAGEEIIDLVNLGHEIPDIANYLDVHDHSVQVFDVEHFRKIQNIAIRNLINAAIDMLDLDTDVEPGARDWVQQNFPGIEQQNNNDISAYEALGLDEEVTDTYWAFDSRVPPIPSQEPPTSLSDHYSEGVWVRRRDGVEMTREELLENLDLIDVIDCK
tara:strand:+ start:2180 stop:2692 length:513 start_codon:yes stop_codon:yes gene_type:complete